jgi:hypothetical protein
MGSHGNKFTCNNRGSVGNSVFYTVRAKGLYNEDTGQAVVSSKSVCEEKLVWDGRQPGS